jgi:hypothetical protein
MRDADIECLTVRSSLGDFYFNYKLNMMFFVITLILEIDDYSFCIEI